MDQTVLRGRISALAVLAFSLVLAVGASPASAAPGATSDALRYAGMPVPDALSEPTASEPTFSLGAATIRLRGYQTLFRIDREGRIGTRTHVQFGTGWVYLARQEPKTFGTGRFVQLLSGPYTSWWVSAPDASLEAPAPFPAGSKVRLAAGTYLGVKFYASGSVRIRRPLTLQAAAEFETTRHATFAGREYYQLSSGPLAGRWVAGYRASLVGQAGSPPPPEPAVPEPEATWKALALVYRETDVTFTRADGTDYHLQARMSAEMHGLVLDTLRRTKSSVTGWSSGLAAMQLTVVDVPHPLRALDKLSNSYWVGPRSVEADINEYAPPGAYDSIFVVWESKDAAGEKVPVGGWGLSLPPGSWANGAGYSSVTTPTQMWWWTSSEAPEEVFIHEWLHQVLYFHRDAGRMDFDLHAGAQYGYEPDNGSWKRWLADVMRGLVRDGNRYVGITPELWRAGSPTQP
ncbi:MAG TPA: hypothetical protein VMZ33_05020 [Candidatus Limnocylindrales bacterium]|nr:hypothetical protein [Candidatus Limnocylindrales bacterium]